MAYDAFFLSYREKNIEEHYNRALEFCPYIKHVYGVKGILESHKLCAERSNTDMLWVIDADNYIIDFDFSFKIKKHNSDQVHLWYTENPVNGLQYGYGGIKLLPKNAILNLEEIPNLDMTRALSKNLIIDKAVASITKFNTSEFDSWKSAFRESIKLCKKIKETQDIEAKTRLTVWSNVGLSSEFGTYCIRGSKSAITYFNQTEEQDLKNINNFDWLYNKFCQETNNV